MPFLSLREGEGKERGEKDRGGNGEGERDISLSLFYPLSVTRVCDLCLLNYQSPCVSFSFVANGLRCSSF